MRIYFISFIVMHGLLHLPEFVRSAGDSAQLSNKQKRYGWLWLAAAGLFILTAVVYYQNHQYWWMMAALSICLSQFLIIRNWKFTKGGTVINLILLIITIMITCTEIRFIRDSREMIIDEFEEMTN